MPAPLVWPRALRTASLLRTPSSWFWLRSKVTVRSRSLPPSKLKLGKSPILIPPIWPPRSKERLAGAGLPDDGLAPIPEMLTVSIPNLPRSFSDDCRLTLPFTSVTALIIKSSVWVTSIAWFVAISCAKWSPKIAEPSSAWMEIEDIPTFLNESKNWVVKTASKLSVNLVSTTNCKWLIGLNLLVLSLGISILEI